MAEFGFCEAREDGSHCECWWDGDACCSCDVGDAMTERQRVDQGMVEGPVESDARS